MSTDNRTYEQFTTEFQTTLAAEGPIEQTFAGEIAGAAWRLRNCTIREAAAELTEAEQKSIDRTRASAQIAMRRCLAELRLLQTERQTRNQLLRDGTDTSVLGVASIKAVMGSRKSAPKRELALNCKNAPEATAASFCKTPIPFPNTPRTRPCPCNSGKKYKNCCGVNAPPVLGPAPRQAA